MLTASFLPLSSGQRYVYYSLTIDVKLRCRTEEGKVRLSYKLPGQREVWIREPVKGGAREPWKQNMVFDLLLS